MKQTAAEWLIQNINKRIDLTTLKYWDEIENIVEQAKLIEIDQMRAVHALTYLNKDFDFEEYIKEHYEHKFKSE